MRRENSDEIKAVSSMITRKIKNTNKIIEDWKEL